MVPVVAANPNCLKSVIFSTGNILNVNNKLGHKSDEELLDGLKLTLECNAATDGKPDLRDGVLLRATDELNQKLTENERPAISIGAKIFLNKNSSACVEQALQNLLQILKVQNVDNVVLAYHPHPVEVAATSPTTPNSAATSSSDTGSSNPFKWSSRNEQTVTELKELWKTLEEFALRKQVTQLGIADLDTETLSELFAEARVPPTIAQINLARCCKVPPALQEFCTENDIQLLTHSDPEILLPSENFIISGFEVDWTLRYQVHVRCRGVITAKGYIVGSSIPAEVVEH